MEKNIYITTKDKNGKETIVAYNTNTSGNYVKDEKGNFIDFAELAKKGKIKKMTGGGLQNLGADEEKNLYNKNFSEQPIKDATPVLRPDLYGRNVYGIMVKITESDTYNIDGYKYYKAVDGSLVETKEYGYYNIAEKKDELAKDAGKNAKNIQYANENGKFKELSKLGEQFYYSTTNGQEATHGLLETASGTKKLVKIEHKKQKYVKDFTTEEKGKVEYTYISEDGETILPEQLVKVVEKVYIYTNDGTNIDYKFVKNIKDATHGYITVNGAQKFVELADKTIRKDDAKGDYCLSKTGEKVYLDQLVEQIDTNYYYQEGDTKIRINGTALYSKNYANYPEKAEGKEGSHYRAQNGAFVDKNTQLYKHQTVLNPEYEEIEAKIAAVPKQIGKKGKQKLTKEESEHNKNVTKSIAELQSEKEKTPKFIVFKKETDKVKDVFEAVKSEKLAEYEKQKQDLYYHDGQEFVKVDTKTTYDYQESAIEKTIDFPLKASFQSDREIGEKYTGAIGKIWHVAGKIPLSISVGLMSLAGSLGPFSIIALPALLAVSLGLAIGGAAVAVVGTAVAFVSQSVEQIANRFKARSLKSKSKYENVAQKAMAEYKSKKHALERNLSSELTKAIKNNRPVTTMDAMKEAYVAKLNSSEMQQLLAVVKDNDKQGREYKKGDRLTSENIESYKKQLSDAQTAKKLKRNEKAIEKLTKSITDATPKTKKEEINKKIDKLSKTRYTRDREKYQKQVDEFIAQVEEPEQTITVKKVVSAQQPDAIDVRMPDQYVSVPTVKKVESVKMTIPLYTPLSMEKLSDKIIEIKPEYKSEESELYAWCHRALKDIIDLGLDCVKLQSQAELQEIKKILPKPEAADIATEAPKITVTPKQKNNLIKLSEDENIKSTLDAVMKIDTNFTSLQGEYDKALDTIEQNGWENAENKKLLELLKNAEIQERNIKKFDDNIVKPYKAVLKATIIGKENEEASEEIKVDARKIKEAKAQMDKIIVPQDSASSPGAGILS